MTSQKYSIFISCPDWSGVLVPVLLTLLNTTVSSLMLKLQSVSLWDSVRFECSVLGVFTYSTANRSSTRSFAAVALEACGTAVL